MVKSSEQDTEIKEPEIKSPVAPIESVDVAVTDPCWNCGEQLSAEGKCKACGFDKSLLHNLDLEAEQAAKKQVMSKG